MRKLATPCVIMKRSGQLFIVDRRSRGDGSSVSEDSIPGDSEA